jgi:hypothetical protein
MARVLPMARFLGNAKHRHLDEVMLSEEASRFML